MQKLPVKGILFDLWNTLIYNVPLATATTSISAIASTLDLEPHQIWRAWGKYSNGALRGKIKSGLERARLVLEDLNLPPEQAPALAQFEQENRSGDVHFFPGVPEMLAELHQKGYKTALVSNTNYLARSVVDRLQIPPKLDAVILSCEVGLVKPEVAIYELAASRLGLETKEVIFVGDGGDNEIEGALAAGCQVAIVQQERGYAFRNPASFYDFAESVIQLPTVSDILSYL